MDLPVHGYTNRSRVSAIDEDIYA